MMDTNAPEKKKKKTPAVVSSRARKETAKTECALLSAHLSTLPRVCYTPKVSSGTACSRARGQSKLGTLERLGRHIFA